LLFAGLLDRCCSPYHFLFLIEEFSTPFLNLRWQYRHQKDGAIYKVWVLPRSAAEKRETLCGAGPTPGSSHLLCLSHKERVRVRECVRT